MTSILIESDNQQQEIELSPDCDLSRFLYSTRSQTLVLKNATITKEPIFSINGSIAGELEKVFEVLSIIETKITMNSPQIRQIKPNNR